jgi:small-conductance mechanosensitive channel
MAVAALALSVLILLLTALGADVSAQTQDDAALSGAWERTLNRAEAALKTPQVDTKALAAFAQELDQIAEKARALATDARQAADETARLIDTLGPAPAADAPAESADAAARRKTLSDALAAQKARLAAAEYSTRRALSLQGELTQHLRDAFFGRILRRYPSPLQAERALGAVPKFLDHVGVLIRAPVDWLRALPAEQRAKVWLDWRAFMLAVAIAAGWFARRLLLQRFGPDPANPQPSYARKFVAAIASAVGEGIMPAGLLLVILLRVWTDPAMISGMPADVIAAACLSLMLLLLSRAFSGAILRPELPAWRVTRIVEDSAKRLHRRILLLTGIIAVDIFLRFASESVPLDPQMAIPVGFVLLAIEAIGIVYLTRSSAWQFEPREQATTQVERNQPPAAAAEPEANADATLPTAAVVARVVRETVAVLALAAVILAAVGYIRLGFYIVDNLVRGALIFGGLYLLRDLGREGIALGIQALPADRLPRVPGWNRLTAIRVWTDAVLDPLLVLIALMLIAPGLGLPREEMSRWFGHIISGFTIGGVTISLADIALAIVVFAATMLVMRAIRSTLTNRVLPQTNIDLGVRNSIRTGVSYLGVTIGLILATGVLGLNLSNLAIVAGALSVGIGFGLQNIVNNFVSGLILLVERPLKVGDWVVIGSHQGTVRRISVRATEIETFDRAELIVPNSEVISGVLLNWTHRNKLGRLEIKVGVDYGADAAKVRDVLLKCAEAHPEIVKWPRPNVVFTDFGASSLDFTLYAFLRNIETRMSVSSELRFAIDAAFRREGIVFPYPQQVVHFAQLEDVEALLRPQPASPPPSVPPTPAPPPVAPDRPASVATPGPHSPVADTFNRTERED